MVEHTFLEEKLLQIPHQHVEQIHVALQWLAFSNTPLLENIGRHDQHPLTSDQLIEATFMPRKLSAIAHKRLSHKELVHMLGDIILFEEVPRRRWINDDTKVTSVRLADGALEVLLSEAFAHGPAATFAVNAAQAKETIAITCLLYLTELAGPQAKSTWVETADTYPLAHLAALFWIDFADTGRLSRNLAECIRSLLNGDPYIFKNWTKLFVQAGDAFLNSKHSSLVLAISHYSDAQTGEHAPPIVYAAAFNFPFIVEEILAQGQHINAAAGGSPVSALYMAVHQKHYEMASLLLRKGGDVAVRYTEPTGRYEYGWAVSPLYLACHKGYPREWIYLLLQDKSKLGRPGWRLEIAMESAARFGHLDCMEGLIDAGADLNKGTCHEQSYGCPLQAACDHGDEQVVRFLLEKGANPNTTGGQIWLGGVFTPLHMTAYRGKLAVVNLLLEHGADPNIQGGDLGNALIASIWNARTGSASDGSLEVVRILLQHEARPNEEWDVTTKLQDLNFNYVDDKKKPLSERIGPDLARWVKAETHDVDDTSPGNEAALRNKIDEKWECIHEGQRQKKFGYSCGCMNEKAFESRFKICTKIRKAAAVISNRLHEAGVSISDDNHLMLNAIQTAVAMERPNLVALLQEYGALMPAVIVTGAEQSVEDAESIARILRQRSSFQWTTRLSSGGYSSSGIAVLP
ncbi:MAG: hypothetical protein Q9201_006584 [Fulgogasparrea decipioides]